MKVLCVFLTFFALVHCSADKNMDVTSVNDLPPLPLNIDDQSLDEIVTKQFQQRINYIKLIEKNHSDKTKLGWAIGQLCKTYQAYLMEPQAIDCYLNAIALQPDNYQWFYLLAHVYRQIGAFKKSIAYFNHTINKNHVPAQIWHVDVLMQDNQIEEAKTLNQTILDDHPDHPMALYHMAWIARQLDDDAAAIVYLEKVLKQQPHAFQIHYQLGQIYAKQGQREKAQQHFKKVPDDSDLRISIHFDDSDMQNVSDLYQGIQSLIKKAIKASKQGYHQQAIKILHTAIKTEPTRIDIQYNLAVVYTKMGDLRRAQETLEAIPSHQNDKVYALLAGIHKSSQQLDIATEYLLKAINIKPQSHEYAMRIANLYHRQKNHENAIIFQQKALDIAIENKQHNHVDNIRNRLKTYQEQKTTRLHNPTSQLNEPSS